MTGHPRPVTEMLNIERRPDYTNKMVFGPDIGVEHHQETPPGY